MKKEMTMTKPTKENFEKFLRIGFMYGESKKSLWYNNSGKKWTDACNYHLDDGSNNWKMTPYGEITNVSISNRYDKGEGFVMIKGIDTIFRFEPYTGNYILMHYGELLEI